MGNFGGFSGKGKDGPRRGSARISTPPARPSAYRLFYLNNKACNFYANSAVRRKKKGHREVA